MPIRLEKCPACGQSRDKGLDDEMFLLSAIQSSDIGGERTAIGLEVTCRKCGFEWIEPPYGKAPGEE